MRSKSRLAGRINETAIRGINCLANTKQTDADFIENNGDSYYYGNGNGEEGIDAETVYEVKDDSDDDDTSRPSTQAYLHRLMPVYQKEDQPTITEEEVATNFAYLI